MSSEDPFYNRRLKGTPAIKFRHRTALAVLAVSGLFAAAFHYQTKSQRLIQMIQERNIRDREDAEIRNFQMSESVLFSSAATRKKKQEEEDSCIN